MLSDNRHYVLAGNVVSSFFKTVLVDGQDLADLKGRPLHKQLAKAGVEEVEVAGKGD